MAILEQFDTDTIQFETEKSGEYLRYKLSPSERIGFIFGNFENRLNIFCEDNSKLKKYKIDFYNPHNLNAKKYINVDANETVIISMFKNDKDEYIFGTPIDDNKYDYFKSTVKNRCDHTPKKDIIPSDFKHIMDFKQKISFLKPDIILSPSNKVYFDLNEPIVPTTAMLGCINTYDKMDA